MKKTILTVILISLICMSLVGCIHWETPVSYDLMNDSSKIQSIRFYRTNQDSYNYSDPNDPCGELLGEITSEEFATFEEELNALLFAQQHLIILFPVAYDPNFYYGDHIVKVEYQDGSCELISYCIQYQFDENGECINCTRYIAEQKIWLPFLKNWVDIPDPNSQ